MTMSNEINDQAEPDRRRPRSREGKTLIGAYVDKDDLYTIKMPVIQRNKEGHLTGGRRATTQDFVLEALREKLEKHTPQPFRSDISRGEAIDALRTLCAFLMV
jgi:hypothetical protein